MITPELFKQYLEDLDEKHYFGKIVLEMKNGKIVDVDANRRMKAVDIRNEIKKI